jgi:hypothetical protein
MVDEVPPRPVVVYRQSMRRLLAIQGPLLFCAIGWYTLPVALVSHLRTKLVLAAGTASWTTGVLRKSTDNYPLQWVTHVAIDQDRLDRRFGCGSLKISTEQGHVYRLTHLSHVEDARSELEARVTAQRLAWRKHAR